MVMQMKPQPPYMLAYPATDASGPKSVCVKTTGCESWEEMWYFQFYLVV